jgi:hydroxymethylpyrimidine/phosphomethylpyrimidine kinase
MRGRVLVVAGSDSGGGAGLQADIKTLTAFGAYAMNAVTAVTAQDTNGVHAIHAVPAAFVRRQIDCVLADIGADVVKTGMLGDADVIEAVAAALDQCHPRIPLIVDPVMIAKGGASLLADDALAHLKRRLLPLASLLTPNLPEAEALTGQKITDEADMRAAAAALLTLGGPAILLKGGHLPGADVVDVLATADGISVFRARRIESRHTHGTGCTLASAIAAGLAQGMALHDAVYRARDYVRQAIAAAPGVGHGHGPLNHAIVPPPLAGGGG